MRIFAHSNDSNLLKTVRLLLLTSKYNIYPWRRVGHVNSHFHPWVLCLKETNLIGRQYCKKQAFVVLPWGTSPEARQGWSKTGGWKTLCVLSTSAARVLVSSLCSSFLLFASWIRESVATQVVEAMGCWYVVTQGVALCFGLRHLRRHTFLGTHSFHCLPAGGRSWRLITSWNFVQHFVELCDTKLRLRLRLSVLT